MVLDENRVRTDVTRANPLLARLYHLVNLIATALGTSVS
jgi:hypothetical protein